MKCLTNNLVLFLAIALLSIVSVGQKSADKAGSAPSPIEVKLNVMVLDAANAYVNDIKLEDIKVFEDDIEQKVTSLVRREQKLDLVLLVDNTGSLRTELDRITTGVGTVIVNLGPKDEAAIVRFISSDKIEVLQEFTSDQAKLLSAAKLMYTEGGASAVIDAVYLAAGKLKERKGPGEKVILLFSDGEDRDSYYSRRDLFKLLEGTDIRIFTIALTANVPQNTRYIRGGRTNRESAEDLVKRFAFESHGATYILDKKIDESMTSAIRAIMIELRSQYLVAYTSSNPKRGTTRKLRIEVAPKSNGEKRQAFTRESIHVPKD